MWTVCLMVGFGLRLPAQTAWNQAGNADAGSSSKLGTTNAVPLRFMTFNTERMRIDSLGNVGIGVPNTTTPTIKARWVVNAPSGSSPLRAMVNNVTKLMVNSNGSLSIGSITSGPTNGLFVSGWAGIGTNNPKSKLDIAGGNADLDASEGDLRLGNDSYRLKMGVATSGATAGDARIRVQGGTGKLMLGPNDALTLGNNGNIGMGTIAPAARLHVKGSDGSGSVAIFANGSTSADRSVLIDLQNGNDSPVPWRYGVGGSGNALGLTSGQFYLERVGGGVRFLVSNTGNVGIGTINPQYKLSVNGTIQAKEVRVETGWADFVFDKNYTLPPLSEVAAFIRKNGHLPGVPSATEIQANGLELAAINTIMMQKIEELTLYVIAQQQKISQLEEQVTQLAHTKKRRK